MDSSLAEMLSRQDGLITRSQALTQLSEAALRHRLGRQWVPVLPGVYAGFTGAMSQRQRKRAAVLYGGGSAQLADVTALREHGLQFVPPDECVYLLIPATEHRMSKEFVRVRRTHRLPRPRQRAGLPYCPPERALVEAAARLADLRTARALIADGIQRGLASERWLVDELPHLSGRGAGVARRAVEEVLAGARSAPECDFLDLCRTSRVLPPPLVNPLIELPDGRRISPDALFEAAGLVHETNGRRAHGDEDRFESMQERSDAMTTADLVVLHNSPRQLRAEGARVLAQAEACFRRHAGRGMPPGVRILRPGPPGTPYVT